MDIRAQLIGYPRIGHHRELKWLLEGAWSGKIQAAERDRRIAERRKAHLDEQRGLIGSAVDDFFLYDEVLETALMLGIVPERLATTLSEDPFAALTALARGTPDHEAWEMTKWFDTNYHFVVPELSGAIRPFSPLPWRQPTNEPDVTWAVLGPYSLVQLSRLGSGNGSATAAAREAGRSLWAWIREWASANPGFRLQVNEPCLGLALTAEDRALLDVAYADAADLGLASSAPIVTVQFGHPVRRHRGAAGERRLRGAGRTGPGGVTGRHARLGRAAGARHRGDGRAQRVARRLRRGPRPPRQPAPGRSSHPPGPDHEPHVPALHHARARTTCPPDSSSPGRRRRRWPAWPAALASGSAPSVPQPPAHAVAGGRPAADPVLPSRAHRRPGGPGPSAFPTTTTGSLPQTSEVRQLRARLGKGELDRAGYDAAVGALITEAISWQERMGLDVLVHGEFERTDMVEYFADQMNGYLTTSAGWVLSYGSRCTRPPILAAPPSIDAPMTVDEWRLAQSATSKPVKGMLTGPVTIVNWSFRPPGIPDDRLFWAVAQPIAQEVGFLVDAGARIIQVDEPAVRERWPLPTEDAAERRAIYARGVRAALNHVFNQPASVQMHTHMCYGDFGDIVPLWSDAGVDVASIEFSRSKDDSYIRQFYELFGDGHLQIGPGVFDVHSPHSPGQAVMDERLTHFETFMEGGDLWVNPDCGLKTRAWDEIEHQLGDMVAAARRRRDAARI